MGVTTLLRKIGLWPTVPHYDRSAADAQRQLDQQRFDRIMRELSREKHTYEVESERPQHHRTV